jgi:RNA repair, ligase-Pnkp-associating, region of Hen1
MSSPVFTAFTNGAPQPESLSRVGCWGSRSLDTVDVAQLSTPKLKSMDPYNSNHVADHYDCAQPGNGLGLPLHKNPERMHSFELSFGKAHLFYPEATSERCTAALLLDVDPIGLVRGKRGQHEGGTLDQYVNDRPYVRSSFLSVAMGRALGTAMTAGARGDRNWRITRFR